MMEATITHRACDYILEGLKKNTINHQSNEIRNLEFPVKLNFDFNAKLYTAITNATTQFDQLAGKHELVVCTYDGYGKSYIKKLGASPDAYAQMAMQLAYYKMYGVSRATYESAGTRQYLNGRTETGRSVSLESVEFCKAMKTPSLTVILFNIERTKGYACPKGLC
jgi:carnitine O-acetyltransferase